MTTADLTDATLDLLERAAAAHTSALTLTEQAGAQRDRRDALLRQLHDRGLSHRTLASLTGVPKTVSVHAMTGNRTRAKRKAPTRPTP